MFASHFVTIRETFPINSECYCRKNSRTLPIFCCSSEDDIFTFGRNRFPTVNRDPVRITRCQIIEHEPSFVATNLEMYKLNKKVTEDNIIEGEIVVTM